MKVPPPQKFARPRAGGGPSVQVESCPGSERTGSDHASSSRRSSRRRRDESLSEGDDESEDISDGEQLTRRNNRLYQGSPYRQKSWRQTRPRGYDREQAALKVSTAMDTLKDSD